MFWWPFPNWEDLKERWAHGDMGIDYIAIIVLYVMFLPLLFIMLSIQSANKRWDAMWEKKPEKPDGQEYPYFRYE
jgi:hypothetical protein